MLVVRPRGGDDPIEIGAPDHLDPEEYPLAHVQGGGEVVEDGVRHIEVAAAAALTHAKLNWTNQKEPGDALTLLRAAQAAQDPQAAEPVWQMVREMKWEDVRLKAVAAHVASKQASGAR